MPLHLQEALWTRNVPSPVRELHRHRCIEHVPAHDTAGSPNRQRVLLDCLPYDEPPLQQERCLNKKFLPFVCGGRICILIPPGAPDWIFHGQHLKEDRRRNETSGTLGVGFFFSGAARVVATFALLHTASSFSAGGSRRLAAIEP